MEKYLVLATFVGSIIALLFVVITAKKVLRFSEGTPSCRRSPSPFVRVLTHTSSASIPW